MHLSKTHSISNSTVERWYHDFVEYRVKELEGRSCPIVLGIDEHFFSRKKGYATTFVALRNHKVFDVVLGKYQRAWDRLMINDNKRARHPLAGKKVKLSSIDPQLNEKEFLIEDWYLNLGGITVFEDVENPAAMIYRKRRQTFNLPLDHNYVYGKIGAYGFIVHQIEIDGIKPEPPTTRSINRGGISWTAAGDELN